MKIANAIKLKNLSLSLMILGAVLSLVSACTNSGEGVNPGLVDIPLVYAKRTIVLNDDGQPIEQVDVREPFSFSAGGDLYLRTTSSSSAAERNISRAVTAGIGDVKDVCP